MIDVRMDAVSVLERETSCVCAILETSCSSSRVVPSGCVERP